MSRINWDLASIDYATDSSQSYETIAKKYGVSKVAVSNHAVKDGWQQKRDQTLPIVIQQLTENKIRTIAEINAQHEQIGEAILNSALLEIQTKDYRPDSFRSAVTAIKIGIDIRRKARGMDNQKNQDVKPDIRDIIEADRIKYGL